MISENDVSRISLGAFYEMVQMRLGIENPVPLIASWDPNIRYEAEGRIGEALASSGFIGANMPDFALTELGQSRTNQSKGNVAARVAREALDSTPDRLRVFPLPGPGYPDSIMFMPDLSFSCCLEWKATSKWLDADGNRRVLTSSPYKIIKALRQGHFTAAPCHLIITIIYENDLAIVKGVRLDFLEPDSPVNVRLEASTSHNLLSSGYHHSVIFD